MLCARCGHDIGDHSESGPCTHYEHGGCACYGFVRPEDATPEMRANRLFPRHWNVIYTNSKPFVLGGDCQRDGCKAKAVERILVNIWGTVVEYETCEACARQWHGKMVDDFPYKTTAKPARGPDGGGPHAAATYD